VTLLCGTGGSAANMERITLKYNTIDLGGQYRLSDNTRLGVMLKNAYGFPLKNEYEDFSLPRHLTIGISNTHSDYTMSFDSEYVFGTFSGLKKKEVEMLFLRAGFEKEIVSWAIGRIGLIYPVIAKTSTLGNIKNDMPWPKIGGALGLGLRYKNFLVDLSIYGDPAKSYVEQTPVISSVLSVTMAF
jgi:hypothetical protein